MGKRLNRCGITNLQNLRDESVKKDHYLLIIAAVLVVGALWWLSLRLHIVNANAPASEHSETPG